MNSLELTSSSSATYWLIFLAVMLVVGLGIGGYVLWLKGPPGEPRHHKRRKRRHRHHRQHNPTLADSGGLPPKRPDGQPPAGP